MSLKNIKNFIENKNCTLLGAGPMSINCVDAVCEIANEYLIPMMLIASRRQVDSKELGGGYVNNWNTDEFSKYVKSRDKNNMVILSRDHGGPWQNNLEIENKYDLKKAMESAKNSYLADIKAGFKILHIDPSIDPYNDTTTDIILDRIYELYDFCAEHAFKNNQEIIYEIGTEEQSGSTNTPDELEYTIEKINSFCDKNKFKRPSFVVIQSGTRVAEMRNIGSFDSEIRVKNELASEIQVPRMIEICEKNNIWMKAHNTDYISNEALQSHPKLGIHAVNIAPEFGVIESQSIVKVLTENNLKNLRDRFLELAYESKKWSKWMIKDSKASNYEKSIIAGHYVFSLPKCKNIFSEARQHLEKKNLSFDNYIKDSVKNGIMRYVKNLNII
jgi:tagatose-1,6-bisphosphate aldolase non-catalytic subunit AgaZ/GatZ